MKLKHSKYKNTGILFELLVRQIASDTISGKESAAIIIVKEYFSKGELAKEHKIYQALINSKALSEVKAESLINATLEIHSRLNKSSLRNEKYNLIKEIKNHYDLEEFFKAKINNYKQHAAVYNLIESKTTNIFIEPQFIIENKITLLEHISRHEVNKEEVKDRVLEEFAAMDRGTRILAYRMLLEKFNEKYGTLAPQQKTVLKEFINNISNTTRLKDFINEQYTKLKSELSKMSASVDEPTTKIKINEVINLIQPIRNNVKDDDIITLLQFHQLAIDLKSVK
jgi:hypothetical protein